MLLPCRRDRILVLCPYVYGAGSVVVFEPTVKDTALLTEAAQLTGLRSSPLHCDPLA